MMSENMIVVCFGAGTNSTAMLIGMKQRGIKPDLILFADTAAEKPHTYKHIDDMQKWLKNNDFPEITIVKKVNKAGEVYTLEQDCLDHNKLPSLAYGFKQCSQKYKIQPQDKYLNNLPEAKEIWKSGGKITKYVGFDMGESHRIKNYDDKKYIVEYPLVDWLWEREHCVEAIKSEGIPLAGKSSCYFCPASKIGEIKETNALYPDLMARAIEMERGAELITVKGLGRNFAWESIIATDDMFPENYIEMSCGCYDG
tara:strand:+ start:1051 stop:1815 length:765 start_codon:yes stop_codon:yes gene_type:complete